VFLPYAHDTPEFADLVRRFYEFLRIDCGIDAVFDRVAAQSPQEWTAWMIRQVAEADFVLCVVSPQYRAAADAELPHDVRRGAQWEARHLRELFYDNAERARRRVLTVLLPGSRVDDVPIWLGPTTGTHYRVEEFNPQAAEKLLRYLHWTGRLSSPCARPPRELRPGPDPPPRTAAGVGSGSGHRHPLRRVRRAGNAFRAAAHRRPLGPADRTMLYRTVGGHRRVLEFVDALLRGTVT